MQGRATVPGAAKPSIGASARARIAAENGRSGTVSGSPRSGSSGGSGGPSRQSGAGGSGGPGGPRGPVRGTAYKRKKGPHWGRIAMVGGALVLVLALLAGIGGYVYYRSIDAGLNRDDPFAQLTGGRPAKPVEGALNMLLLGSDSRDPDNKGNPGQWRSDTIIVLHVNAAHDKAYLVSLPRDLYVHIPKSKSNPKYGDTKAKINASFAWGGSPLTLQTVEEYTQVRLDHLMLIDFGGFKNVIDALGGIDMNVETTITSIHPPKRVFKAGMNHFNGAEALDYARQRYQFPDGDFARMRHQQQMMKAIMDKAASSGTLTNPAKLNAFLKAVTKAVTVDKDFSLADMARQFHGLRSNNLQFIVSPNSGSKTIGGESLVVPDAAKATALYDAVNNDKMDDWMAKNQPAPKPSGSTKSGN
jgi:LCP family protein required for cell wall assembly